MNAAELLSIVTNLARDARTEQRPEVAALLRQAQKLLLRECIDGHGPTIPGDAVFAAVTCTIQAAGDQIILKVPRVQIDEIVDLMSWKFSQEDL